MGKWERKQQWEVQTSCDSVLNLSPCNWSISDTFCGSGSSAATEVTLKLSFLHSCTKLHMKTILRQFTCTMTVEMIKNTYCTQERIKTLESVNNSCAVTFNKNPDQQVQLHCLISQMFVYLREHCIFKNHCRCFESVRVDIDSCMVCWIDSDLGEQSLKDTL